MRGLIRLSLGIIETVGLVAAINAADTAVKTANVELVGYEISNGDGLVTVKIQGDVSSVKAAIMAASISAAKVNKVFATTIIARPEEMLEKLIFTEDTVGIEKPDCSDDSEDKVGQPERKPTCNLCMDPKCPRIKGESRNICIRHN